MARKDPSVKALEQLITAFMRLPFRMRLVLISVVLVGGLVFLIAYWICTRHPEQHSSAPDSIGPKTVLLCHWNLENLFDDRDDRRRQPDEEYDQWFVNDPEARTWKYKRISDALLELNAGKGPDLIIGNEVESYRAAEILRDALNAKLPAGATPYGHVAMKELNAGRHIAPCVISRYPLSGAKLLGRRQRILEVHVVANGHDLRLIASHWTSKLSDQGADESRGRFGYANVIYEEYREAIREQPTVDLLVCGDFNDIPESDPVAGHLHVSADPHMVTPTENPPRLFGLLSGKSPGAFGTHYFNGPVIYDQIAISPGLLDPFGWQYLADSVQVPTSGLIRSGSTARRPWRFGSKTDSAINRGFSDHFPVIATLKVAE
jgi:endonuclease/exonuclease/phosphatase family metal-dependent hydrolase